MNTADSDEMSSHLLKRGWTLCSNKEEADAVLLNTCTVRQHAEQKALSFIGRLKDWKKKKPGRMVIITGCMAEHLKKTLQKRFPVVDLVVGAKSIEEFPDQVHSFLKEKRRAVVSYDWFNESEKSFGEGGLRAEGTPMTLGNSETTAFITIMRGCNYSCSYCIVPEVRGREVYRPAKVILEEIHQKISQGFSDVMLLGQTVNSYRQKPDDSGNLIIYFSDLIQEVNSIGGVRTIRFMSPHPYYMNDRLIQTLAQCKKISPQIHLPVQSGSNAILKLMRRNYSREEYIRTAQKLIQAVPRLELSTDFIVGFPQESEEDFLATLSLLDEIRFGNAYCFKYSPRKGTESSKMADSVPQEKKEERLKRLLAKCESMKRVHV